MTYRSLDLQISIPRTPEAGGLQSQMMNRPMIEQQKLADESLKTTEQLRQKSSEVEETVETAIRDDQQGQARGKQDQQPNEEKAEAAPETPAPHPFKGHHIDISL
ncbi:hypothetical protein [Paenibacillus daejeonensis]|uniref:hypothetical protein n=1 Tax=Paenibacillus daejeonensis TaxID=135193 RepID=UPI0004766079|nr:hypothetical protein [Paenibacillus daejeonensis]